MTCPKCDKEMYVIQDEAMGQLLGCAHCGTEKVIYFDKTPVPPDRV